MKNIIRFLALAAIISASVICVASVQAQLRSPPRPLIDALRASQLKSLHVGFHKAIGEGRITLDDWEKLDFTQPNAPGFGDNLQYEVFNPKSPRSIIIGGNPTFPLIPRDMLDKITIRPEQALLFNLRRMTYKLDDADGGGEVTLDVLVTVIPYVNPIYCSDSTQRYGLHTMPPTVHVRGERRQEDKLFPVSDGYGPAVLSCNQPNPDYAYYFLPFARRIRISNGVDPGGWKLLATADSVPERGWPFSPL